MARDRLAAMRAQQQGNVGSNSYPTQASGNGGNGYQNRRPNPYAQQDDRSSYEMADVRDSRTHLTPSTPTGGGGDMAAFYAEISSIQDSIATFNQNIKAIGELHSQSLNNMDDSIGSSRGSGRDGQIKKQQAAFVKSKFVEAIQNYQAVEQQYRTKYKQRMERQYKIVKPDATPDEIRAVVNDEQGGQIFSQASRAAYREVQERHEDIKRIERTLAELAQLFNDMSVLVEQQEETINVIQAQAAGVEKDTEVGLQYTDKAVSSARAARKKRWICFFITLVLLAIIGIIVGIVVKNQIANNNNNTNNTSKA
ncbi:syntaxin [Pholiota molesta]|nr:syntaxin [Pholiota molesta]